MHWTLPRLNRFHDLLGSREHAQDMVEYGLIVACVAVVVAVGANVLSAREAEYFNGLPLSPAAPAAPGALSHPTSTSLVCNPPGLPALVQTSITCVATVQDVFSNASDLRPPGGTVTWTFPDSSTHGSCVLPTPATGSQTSCSSTDSMAASWYIPGTPSITVNYAPTTNHMDSQGSSSLTIIPPNMVPSCTSNGQVELGNPLDCRVTLTSGGNKLASQEIIWRHDVGNAAGVGIFTCRTQGTGYDIWKAPECPPPDLTGTAAFFCVTDVNGSCGLIYRRLYDRAGGGAGANPVLTLTLTYADKKTSTTVGYNAIRVTAPTSQHATDIAAVCSLTSGSATVSPGTLTDGNATFDTSASIAITSGTAWFSCSVRVLDTRPNPAASNGNPDLADAFPPLGSVGVSHNGSIVGNCTLQPAATSASPPPAQALGQEPFFASCTTPIFPLAGASGSSGTLVFDFGAEPAHAASSLAIPVTFT